MSSIAAEIIDPIDLSLYQPPFILNEVEREASISSIQNFFDNEARIVFVVGESGIGKTTLLSQFIKHNKKNSIGIFLEEQNKSSLKYEPIANDICIQISALLNEDINTNNCFDPSLITSKFTSLRYQLRKEKRSIFVILDGFDALIGEDEELYKKILESIPTTDQNIKIIISTNDKKIKKTFKLSNSEDFSVPLMTISEAINLLPEEHRNPEGKNILQRIKKTPGNIANISRLLITKEDFEEVSNQIFDKINPIEIEWEKNIKITNEEIDCISFLAFNDSSTPFNILTKISKNAPENLLENLRKITFLKSDKNIDMNFISAEAKEHARKKLSHKKNEAIENIISFLSNEKHKNLTSISSIYSHDANYPAAIDVLSNENMLGFIEKKKSLTELVRQMDIGLKAAEKLSRDHDILRFSHLKGLVRGIEGSMFMKNEIKSHLEKENISCAVDLAMTARSNEEKLQLLALIYKHQKNNGREIDESIKDEIESLYLTIDAQVVGLEKTMAIALELFPIMPEKALDLITKVDPLGVAGENNSEYAFFRFSLSSLLKESDSLKILDDNSGNLSDEKKKIIESLKLFKRGTPADAILKEFKNEKSPGDEIFILRNWIKSFPKSKDNYLLINRVMELAISTSNYTANAGFYYDMITANYETEEKETAQKIYERIISQLPTAKRLGPTAEYIKLQLEIYKYELKMDIVGSRLTDVYHECTNDTPDQSVSLLGLCLIEKFIEDNHIRKFVYNIKSEKEKRFDNIIKLTADHFEILKEPLKIESIIKVKNAITWAEKFNVASRKEEALELIISQSSEHCKTIEIETICDLVSKISNESLRKKAFSSLLKRVIKNGKITENEWKRINKLKGRFTEVRFLCKSHLLLAKIYKNQDFFNEQEYKKIKDSLIEHWDKTDGDWKKVDFGFYIHSYLHSIDEEFSADFLEKIRLLRGDEYIYSDEVASAYLDSVDLALRAFHYMSKEKMKLDKEMEKLLAIISSLPSIQFRARQLSRLCASLQLCEKFDQSAKIIENDLLKILENLNPRSEIFRSCFYWISPVLAKYDLECFKKYYALLSYEDSFQDLCVGTVFEYYFSRTMVGDPFESVKNFKPDLSYKDMGDAISIVALSKSSNVIYVCLKKISKIVTEKYHKDKKITQSQYRDLKLKIEQTINSTIKNSDFINHEGYFICAQGIIYDLEQCKDKPKWAKLINDAGNINNSSDAAFIISSLAEMAPASLKEQRIEWFKKSMALIESLPSDLDKINRYEDLSEKVRNIDKNIAKDCIKYALGISAAYDSDEFEEKRRSLIDVAYSMDNEYGENVSALFDADPAKRSIIEKNIANKKEEILLSDKFNSEKGPEKKFDPGFPKLAWKNVAKINANNFKIDRKKSDQRSLISSIFNYEPHDMYALLSFYIAATSASAKGEENARKIMMPIFEVMISNIGLFLEMYKVGKIRTESSSTYCQDDDHVVVEIGERHKAIDFITNWISKNSIKNFHIVDKYFCIEDLNTVAEIINKDPNFQIKIFTVQKREDEILKRLGSNNPLEDVIEDYWKSNISSESIPNINITFASIKDEADENFPIHDRWWISENSGIRLGTSINGLGNSYSEISILTSKQLQNIEQTIGGFLNETQREIKGKKIRYKNYKI